VLSPPPKESKLLTGRRADEQWAIYGVWKSCGTSSISTSYGVSSQLGTQFLLPASFRGKDAEASELKKRTEELEAACVEQGLPPLAQFQI
jgi:hypothetical protein